MLFDVGFETNGLAFNEDELRVVAYHSLINESRPVPSNSALKKIVTFSFMYLQAQTIDIKNYGTVKKGQVNVPLYKISIIAKQTVGVRSSAPVYKDMVFQSDGSLLAPLANFDEVTYIDGLTPYFDAWQYCWQNCLV